MLRWRGGLERIEGLCLLADCCRIEWGEAFGREKGCMGKIQTCLWISDGFGVRNKQKCLFVACWFIDESEVSLVFTIFSIDKIRKNRRNI